MTNTKETPTFGFIRKFDYYNWHTNTTHNAEISCKSPEIFPVELREKAWEAQFEYGGSQEYQPYCLSWWLVWRGCDAIKPDGTQFCYLTGGKAPGKDLYTFGEPGKWEQQRGIPERNVKHRNTDEVVEYCQPLCEKKGMIVLPNSDRNMSDPAVKGNAWDMNYARGSHLNTKYAEVYSHVDVYLDTDDMCNGCK